MGKVRMLAIAVLALMALCAAPAASAQAVPATFWGAVPQVMPTAEQLQRLHRGGVDSLRVGVGWDSVQANRGGAFDWSGVDARFEEIDRAGIEILPFLSGAPSWAVRQAWVPGTHHTSKAPERLPASGAAASGWAGFVRAAVERYGPGGSFWTAHPALPQRPIRAWQIWNEENFKYFVTRPNPAEYGKLVKISYGAMHSVDPGAQLILGGMFAKPREANYHVRPPWAYYASTFLEKMYRETPGIGSRFQGVALHPYTTDFHELVPYVEELRAVLKRNHDAGKGLWITEMGWSSEPPSFGDSFAKGPAGQAKQLKGAFGLLERMQARWHVKRVYWFSVDDVSGVCNFCGGSGLFANGFAPKKSWYAYVKFAGGKP